MLAYKLLRLVETHSNPLAAGLLAKIRNPALLTDYNNVPPEELRQRVHEIDTGTWRSGLLTGRGLPRKPVPEKMRTVAQSPGPPALPKVGLLTTRRNGSAVPLHASAGIAWKIKLPAAYLPFFSIPKPTSHDGRVAAELTTEYGRITIRNGSVLWRKLRNRCS